MDMLKDIAIFLIFITMGTVLYINSLDNPFVYDDDMYIVKNMNIRDLDNIPRFFTSPRLSTNDPSNAGHYRPLVVTSYAVNYAVGGLNPFGYHIVNLGFHAGAAFLLYLLMKYLMNDAIDLHDEGNKSRNSHTHPSWRTAAFSEPGSSMEVGTTIIASHKGGWRGWWSPGAFMAFAAGSIFLVHPFNAEAVNYSTARSSLMSGFFYLLGFYCWIRFRGPGAHPTQEASHRGRFYIFSLLAFALGMLSKEVVITLPVILWLYDLYFFKGRQQDSFIVRYIYYLPFLLMILIPYLLIRRSSFGNILPHFKRDLLPQFFTEVPVMVKHWRMFVVPKGLSLVHDIPVYTGLTAEVFISIVCMGVFISIAAYLFRKENHICRLISFFMSWFIIVLLPTTIIPLNAIFQENRGYLAFVSFAVLGGIILYVLVKRARRASVALLVSILLFYSGLTIHRNMVWGDDLLLWEDALRKAPRSAIVYAALSRRYAERGDLNRSIEMAKEGLKIDPRDYYLHLNLARTYQLMGDTDKAIEEYDAALKIDPRRATVLHELAMLYIKKGDLDRAEGFLRESIRIWGDLPPLHYNLGVVLKARGRFTEAVEVFGRAIRLYPDYIRARYEMAEVLEMLGRSNEAALEYREIIRIGLLGLRNGSLLYGQDKVMIENILEKTRQRLAKL